MLLTEISQSLMEEHLSTLQGLCIMANRQWSYKNNVKVKKIHPQNVCTCIWITGTSV